MEIPYSSRLVLAKSILTCLLYTSSALKRVDTAAYYFAEQVKNGTFQGGTMVFDASNDGIGFPKENPNLSDEIVKAMEDALAKIKSGEIVVDEAVQK